MLARTFGGSPMPESFHVVPSKCMLTLPVLSRVLGRSEAESPRYPGTVRGGRQPQAKAHAKLGKHRLLHLARHAAIDLGERGDVVPLAAGNPPTFAPSVERIENQELVGFTSTHVLSEIAHRMMTIETFQRFGRPFV